MFLEKQKRSDTQVRITIADSLLYVTSIHLQTCVPVCVLVACDSGFIHVFVLFWEQQNGVYLPSATQRSPSVGLNSWPLRCCSASVERKEQTWGGNLSVISRCGGNVHRVTCCYLQRSSRDVGNNAGFDVCLTTATSNSGAIKQSLASYTRPAEIKLNCGPNPKPNLTSWVATCLIPSSFFLCKFAMQKHVST